MQILTNPPFDLQLSYDLSELDLAAEQVLKHSSGRKLLAFYGPMGVGKTTLIKEICRHLGYTGIVTSPTFSIVNEYLDTNCNPIYHFDFYRFTSPEDAFNIGIDEYFSSDAYCLMEWPELIEPLLPDDTLRISLTRAEI